MKLLNTHGHKLYSKLVKFENEKIVPNLAHLAENQGNGLAKALLSEDIKIENFLKELQQVAKILRPQRADTKSLKHYLINILVHSTLDREDLKNTFIQAKVGGTQQAALGEQEQLLKTPHYSTTISLKQIAADVADMAGVADVRLNKIKDGYLLQCTLMDLVMTVSREGCNPIQLPLGNIQLNTGIIRVPQLSPTMPTVYKCAYTHIKGKEQNTRETSRIYKVHPHAPSLDTDIDKTELYPCLG